MHGLPLSWFVPDWANVSVRRAGGYCNATVAGVIAQLALSHACPGVQKARVVASQPAFACRAGRDDSQVPVPLCWWDMVVFGSTQWSIVVTGGRTMACVPAR